MVGGAALDLGTRRGGVQAIWCCSSTVACGQLGMPSQCQPSPEHSATLCTGVTSPLECSPERCRICNVVRSTHLPSGAEMTWWIYLPNPCYSVAIACPMRSVQITTLSLSIWYSIRLDQYNVCAMSVPEAGSVRFERGCL